MIEDPTGPTQYRDIGVCTEKWVEVITASKQTDTEDFPYNATESPCVADIDLFDALKPNRIVSEEITNIRHSVGALPVTSAFQQTNSSFNLPTFSRKSPAVVSVGTTQAYVLPNNVLNKNVEINKEKEILDSKVLTREVAKIIDYIKTKTTSKK